MAFLSMPARAYAATGGSSRLLWKRKHDAIGCCSRAVGLINIDYFDGIAQNCQNVIPHSDEWKAEIARSAASFFARTG